MPHKYMGVDFPLYQEPKTKAARSTTPTPQQILTEAALHWPSEALPFAYATACVQIVLLRSREASSVYYVAIKALELPGCQVFIKKAKVQAQDTNAWSSKTTKNLLEKGIKSLEKGKDIPSLPWLTTIEQYKDNTDYLHFIECVKEFVRIGFNRQADLAEKRPKVLVENAPFLFFAITFRAIAEYCEVKLKNWNKYRPDYIDDIMTGSDPNTRAERLKVRLKKREIKQRYEQFKWVLHRNKTLLKYADQWYKCRVNPGTIEAYLQELADLDLKDQMPIYLDRGRISNDIAACDEATGYPRKWRK